MALKDDEGGASPPSPSLQRILKVATTLFFEKGYGATSIRDVADQLGVAKSSLYKHVRNKEDLLFRVVLAEHEHFHACVIGADDPSEPVRTRIASFFTRHLQELMADTLTARVASRPTVSRRELDDLTEEHLVVVSKVTRAYQDHLRDLIALGQSTGEIRSDLAPDISAKAALGMLNGLSNWYQPGVATSDQIIRNYLTMLFQGLACDDDLDRRAVD